MYENRQYEKELRGRVVEVMREKMLTQRALSQKTGFQASNLSQILKGTRDVPETLISGILSAFPDIDSMWLVHGVGKMYSTANGTNAEATRPRLPVSATAGRLSVYVDGVMRSQCDEMPIIRNFPDYDFTMFIKGNSMEPKYESGDEIALKRVTSIIEWGKDYVLDTEDGAIFKKIYEDGDNIRCVSYNSKEYPDFLVPKSSVYGFYRFVGLVRV